MANARAMWRGSLSFGLVIIPVSLTTATEEKGVEFRQVHDADGHRIKFRRFCSGCGEEVPYENIAKGYERGDGTMIMLDADDFESLPLNTTKTIAVDHFCPASSVDADLSDRLYYVNPDPAGEHAYELLHEALRRSKMVAIAKVALRGGRERLVAVKPGDGVLSMTMLRWPDEVREKPDLDLASPRKDELTFALRLIETMTRPFDPAEHHDAYREALIDVVEAKSAGTPLAKHEDPAPVKQEQSLLDALEASLAAQEPAVPATTAKAPARRGRKKAS